MDLGETACAGLFVAANKVVAVRKPCGACATEPREAPTSPVALPRLASFEADYGQNEPLTRVSQVVFDR